MLYNGVAAMHGDGNLQFPSTVSQFLWETQVSSSSGGNLHSTDKKVTVSTLCRNTGMHFKPGVPKQVSEVVFLWDTQVSRSDNNTP
jgi:hypothetical protein